MSDAQASPHMRDNLAQLQTESLHAITILAAGIVYAWALFLMWPITGGQSPSPLLGLAVISLLLGTGIGFSWREKNLVLAANAFVWGSLVAIGLTVLRLDSPTYSFLLVIPVIFSSVLLGQRGFAVVSAVANMLSLATLGLGIRHSGADLGGIGATLLAVLPIIPTLLVTVCAWLSSRNLHAALLWVWAGYEQAHQNEQLVRERAGELRRALRALEEASFRIERANYLLALARDRAEEARRLKQQFAQNISHELRTPLNLIVGFTELMTETPEYYGATLPSGYARDLNIVHRNAQHLQNLVNDVLDLARIDAAQMTILPERVDVGDLIRDVINTTQSLVESRGLRLCGTVAQDLPAIWVDPTRIRQVLINLVNNAARFTDQGGVSIMACADADQVLFSVSDTGVGIPPEELERIFEEFHQADGSIRRRHGGAGLGLAISRRFVELHGGRIWAQSEVGRGSTFHFALPLADDPLGAVLQPNTATVETAARAHREMPLLMAVSPNPAAAALLARYRGACRTIAVPSEVEARAMAKRTFPQVVILDEEEHHLDLQDLRGLATEWGVPSATFVLCSLPDESKFVERLDVQGYLIKPLSRQELWDVMRGFGDAVDKVLVVDDDLDFVQLMRRMLEDNPVRRYAVIEAFGGYEALDMMRYHRPDLLLLDLELPDLDGFQVLKRMRAVASLRDIPVVIVSGEGARQDQGPLDAGILLYRAGGWMPGEMVRQVQAAIDAAIMSIGDQPALSGGPAVSRAFQDRSQLPKPGPAPAA